MNFLDKLTPGELLAAVSYLIAVVIFVYSMKPRLDAHDEKFKSQHEQFLAILDWQKALEIGLRNRDREYDERERMRAKDQDTLSRERDNALNQVAIGMSSLASTMSELGRSVSRIEGKDIK